MIEKLLENLRGKDDLERIAYKEDLALLNAYWELPGDHGGFHIWPLKS
jgi:hypothetical protein